MSARADIKLAKSCADRLQLSQSEQRLIADFRRMSEKSRADISQFSNVIADKDVAKARKAAPALRLVVGGAL